MTDYMALELERLIVDLEWAKAHELPARELVPMLRKLVAAAPEGSPERHFARSELARLVVSKNPWLAARLAHDVLRHGDDERAWGVLGLAHTVLGNYRSALRAYRRALELSQAEPEYEHNLGHLLDVAFNRPRAALPHLERAHAALPNEPEIASSLAHALVGIDRNERARRLLAQVYGGDHARADELIASWSRQRR